MEGYKLTGRSLVNALGILARDATVRISVDSTLFLPQMIATSLRMVSAQVENTAFEARGLWFHASACFATLESLKCVRVPNSQGVYEEQVMVRSDRIICQEQVTLSRVETAMQKATFYDLCSLGVLQRGASYGSSEAVHQLNLANLRAFPRISVAGLQHHGPGILQEYIEALLVEQRLASAVTEIYGRKGTRPALWKLSKALPRNAPTRAIASQPSKAFLQQGQTHLTLELDRQRHEAAQLGRRGLTAEERALPEAELHRRLVRVRARLFAIKWTLQQKAEQDGQTGWDLVGAWNEAKDPNPHVKSHTLHVGRLFLRRRVWQEV